jgi:hypothetical protein
LQVTRISRCIISAAHEPPQEPDLRRARFIPISHALTESEARRPAILIRENGVKAE